MLVPVLFDTKAYREKPAASEVGFIKGRMKRAATKPYRLKEVYDLATAGYSFVPAWMAKGGLASSDWMQQAMFAIDIDGGITPEEALEKYTSVGVKPFAWYPTYSDTPEHRKFRVLVATRNFINDGEVRDKVQAILMGVVGCADSHCSDRARYFNGTSKEGKYFGNVTNSLEHILSLEKEGYAKCVASQSKPSSNRSRKPSKDYTIEVDSNVVPFCPGYLKANAKTNVDALLRVFGLRAWKEKDHRERFAFCLYNNAKLAYGADEALELTREKVSEMEEPLSERELYYAITHTEEHVEATCIHGDGVFTFNRETIAGESWLALTEEEILQSGFLATKRKNDRANKNRPIKNAIKEKVIDLSKEGKTTKEIEFFLKEEGISLSLRTIQRYIKNDKIPQMGS